MSHVLVVGSGIAGLTLALEASRHARVTLVTKAELAESNTRYAQGGIAAALFADDSVESHAADTVLAGAGLSDSAAVDVLCAEGPARIRDLIALGVGFDRHGDELARGLEAAHSSPRVLHAGGDATGAVIQTALVDAVRRSSIVVREHTFLVDIVVGFGRVRGVRVLDRSGRTQVLESDTVVLASGGAGQLYRHTTNPSVATGDGAAAALRAGAVLGDAEFYQFHPTALAAPGNFLVSEAVRGEGAVLLDARGRRFLLDLHERAELAPRDVVARGIAGQMAKQGGAPVLLDATALGAAFLAERFPSIDRACRTLGLDWSEHPIPVTPAAHYWMGGVRTDEWGRSSIPGLYAVGEVANTGVHGANRLASNSLLEALVFAWRAASRIAEPSDDWPGFGANPWEFADAGSAGAGSERASTERADTAVADASVDAPASADERRGGSGRSFPRTALRDLAWSNIGLYRDAAGLRSAAGILSSWEECGDSVEQRETRNMLELARVMVRAALAREESRGAHFRTDFPEPSDRFVRRLDWSGIDHSGSFLSGPFLPSTPRPDRTEKAVPAC